MTKETKRVFTNLAIAVAIGIAIKLTVPLAYGLTAEGVTWLAIFVPTIILYITTDTVWTSIMSLSILAFTKLITPYTIWNYLWGNSITPYFILFFMLTGVLTRCGAMEWVAKWFISRKIVKGKPYMFCFMMFLTITLLGFVCSPAVMIVLFLNVLKEVTESIGCTTKDSFYKSIALGVGWVTQSQDGVRPFSKPQPAVILGLLATLGITGINTATFLLFGLPFAVIIIVCVLLVMKFAMKPDFTNFKNYDDAALRQWLKDNPMTKRGKLTLFGLIAILIMWLLPFLPTLPLSAFFNGQTTAAVGIVAAILCVIPAEDGKPVMDMKQASSYVPWHTLIMIGTCLFYATCIGNEEFGITEAMMGIITPFTVGMSPVMAVSIGLFICLALTNVISNLVAGTLTATVFTAVLMGMPSVSPGLVCAYGMATSSIAALGFLTMSASSVQPLIFSDETIPIKGTVRYSALYCLLTYVVSVPLVFLVANWL